ncbi:hypothetical protein PoB_000919900 [Plakobranchus ocellatus]|uniref:Uncharacterized protein n=1 Tax=Plakobranchus ocellatus TaxID=259542 RepID=A0AAV3YI64_9GAST|nr:hypothetical protein PoB_000919900 [Plakobranchus ocellatus]
MSQLDKIKFAGLSEVVARRFAHKKIRISSVKKTRCLPKKPTSKDNWLHGLLGGLAWLVRGQSLTLPPNSDYRPKGPALPTPCCAPEVVPATLDIRPYIGWLKAFALEKNIDARQKLCHLLDRSVKKMRSGRKCRLSVLSPGVDVYALEEEEEAQTKSKGSYQRNVHNAAQSTKLSIPSL